LLAIGAFLLAAVLGWIQAPTALIVVFAVLSAGSIVAALTAPREDRVDDARLVADVQRELVAVIEDGKSLGPDIFRPPHYGPYMVWRDKTAAFVMTVFGPVERQRFSESYDPPPTTLARNLEDCQRRLADPRDRPHTWVLRVNAEGLCKAIEERRSLSVAEQIVTATNRSRRPEPWSQAKPVSSRDPARLGR
jgi:hypothetical protein